MHHDRDALAARGSQARQRVGRGVGVSIELGLHLNLTEGTPLSAALRRHWPRFPRLSRLIVQSHLGALPLAAIADEWRAQLDAFTSALGHEPQFVDGHQHVHHLPGVRAVVLDGVAAFARPPGIRSTGHVLGPGSAFKRRVIEATGGRALERALRARGLPHNRALLGAYGFDVADYRELVVGWLAAAPASGGLLFCHPCAERSADSIGAARSREAAYFGSERFAADLDAAGVSLGPTWQVAENSSDG